MNRSRRQFLKAGAAAAAALLTGPQVEGKPRKLKNGVIARAIVSLFNQLPGDKGLKISRHPQAASALCR